MNALHLRRFCVMFFVASQGLWGAVAVRAADFTVTNTNNSGPGSLRQAIADATAAGVAGTISFNIGTGSQTIVLSAELVVGTDVVLDGTTQPGYTGSNLITISGNGASRVFHVTGGTVSMKALTITRGWMPAGNGGAIWNAGQLSLAKCIVSASSVFGGHGGGIYNDYGGLTLTDCTVSGNATGSVGLLGGGIASDGGLTLTRCTVNANTASGAGGGIYANNGGLTMVNCTISGNTGTEGGGIHSGYSCTTTLTACTLSGNRGDTGGGFYGSNSARRTLTSCIVANSTGGGDTAGRYTDGGHNIIEDNTGVTQPTSKSGDPLLGPLADNGGSTQTHALLAGSPAIDAGDCAETTTDQRGVSRPQRSACDIGAFELEGTPTLVALTSLGGYDYGSYISFTATVTGPAGSATPTGTVSFFDGTNNLGTATLDGSGVAVYGTTTLDAGTHSIKAVYNGSAIFNRGTSSVLTILVNPAGTITVVTSAINPSVFGEPVTLQASVYTPRATIAGGVQFYIDGSPYGSQMPLNTLKRTSLLVYDLAPGLHTVSANFLGNNNFSPSSGTLSGGQTVLPGDTTVAISSSSNPCVVNEAVTYTLQVVPVRAAFDWPRGMVMVTYDGNTVAIPLDFGATAKLVVAFKSLGSHQITANYLGDTNFKPSAPANLDQVVIPASTTTDLTLSPSLSTFGQSVTLTAAVGVNPPGSGTPTGDVTFSDGSTLLGVASLDGAGVASLSLSKLLAGGHVITAVYGGDPFDFPSTSKPLKQFVQQAGTTTVVTSSLNPSTFSTLVTFTATVTTAVAGAGAPTGTVTFDDGGTVLGTAALDPAGVATLAIDSLGSGNHPISASYGGDANWLASISSPLVQIIDPATTTVVVTSSVNPSVFGQLVTLTAAVSASPTSAGTPVGTVQFLDGVDVLGTAALDGSGVATLSIGSLPSGSRSITAVYSGDTNTAGSASSPFAQIVNPATTTLVVTSSVNPSVFGQLVTLTASVSASPASAGTPVGTVQFMDGVDVLGTAVLDGSGIATLSTGSLPSGSRSITAVYSGDTNMAGSASPPFTQNVNPATTTTALNASPASSTLAEKVTLTATVSAVPPGAGTPGGTVSFRDGATEIGTAALDASGHATLLTGFSPGEHVLTAAYSGDADFRASASAPLTQAVSRMSTATSLVSSSNPAPAGATVALSATVIPAGAGAGTPTGSVNFLDNGELIGTGTLDGNGAATFALKSLAPGDHSITAAYGGDSNFTASTSVPLTQGVGRFGTTTVLTSSRNPASVGTAVIFTANVPTAQGVGTPGGAVQFVIDGSAFGAPVVLSEDAYASIRVESLAVGTHTVAANYVGEARYSPSSATLAGGQVLFDIEIKADTTPPSPSPATWQTVPTATGTSSVHMVATTASDSSGVEYLFECSAGGGHSSGWQDSPIYDDTDLQPNTTYTYRVQARDKSAGLNTGEWSSSESATTASVADPQEEDSNSPLCGRTGLLPLAAIMLGLALMRRR